MESNREASPRQLTSSVELRAEFTQTDQSPHSPSDPTPRSKRARNALGYRFDPVPTFLGDLIKAEQLAPFDELVLKTLLRFRLRINTSCWATKQTVADALGVHPRTVQRSFARLSATGVIEQRPVASPDPDEPRNRTGWRIEFLWLRLPEYVPGPGPVRAGRLGGIKTPPETPVSPPGETVLSCEGETTESPKHAGGSKFNSSDGVELDKIPSSFSSVSSISPRLTTQETKTDNDDGKFSRFLGEAGEKPAGFRKAMALALRWFPDSSLAEIIEGDFERIDRKIEGRWDEFTAAVFMAGARKQKPDNLMGWLLTVTADYGGSKIPTEATQGMDRARQAEEEIARVRRQEELKQAEAARLDAMTAEQLIEEAARLGNPLRLGADGKIEFERRYTEEFVPLRDRMIPKRSEILGILRARSAQAL